MRGIRRLLPVLRTLVYVVLFAWGWSWVISSVARLDPRAGDHMPAWLEPIGYVLVFAGCALMLVCVFAFAVRGRGTPAPMDAPRQLVIWGPYRSVRNPIYVGLVAALVGMGLILRSPAVLILAGITWALTHLLVVLYEEPTLKRRFGESYVAFTEQVNRWVPRRPVVAAGEV